VAIGNLLGLSPRLDEILRDFPFFATVHKDSHPANAGDVSQVLDDQSAEAVEATYGNSATPWYDIENLEALGHLRNDGRSGYRIEGVVNPRFYELVRPLAGRLMLITRTGAQLPAISQTISTGDDGKLFICGPARLLGAASPDHLRAPGVRIYSLD
jgi:hypothetical protein